MTIDIRGTQTSNKGALLLLESIVDVLGHTFPLSTSPRLSDYSVRASLGLLQSPYTYHAPRVSREFFNRIPKAWLESYGIVAEKEFSGILDASGFAYSDSFGVNRIKSEALLSQRWNQNGIPHIFLPQAFGPFRDHDKRKWSTRLLEGARLLYARDTESAEYLDALGFSSNVAICPDITIATNPVASSICLPRDFAAIVPNAKMISSGKFSEDNYITLLSSYIGAASKNGLNPIVVVHESGDATLARKVAVPLDVEVVREEDPKRIKWILSQAEITVASRYHAIVGSLSTGVPTIALGWSHKYGELLKDFAVPDWEADPLLDPNETIRRIADDADGIERARTAKSTLLVRIDSMWGEVRNALCEP